MTITNYDIDYTLPELSEPFQEVITVTNAAPEGTPPVVWPADGKVITMPPGHVARMKRWQFMLGLKQPNAYEDRGQANPYLRELSEEEGTLAYREAKKQAAKAEVERLKGQLAEQQLLLKKAEAAVVEESSRIETAVNGPPPGKPDPKKDDPKGSKKDEPKI